MEQTNVASIKTLSGRQVIVNALWIVGFALVTAVGAQIEIPHQPVPYTLQTFFVLLAGAFLGKRNGALSQLLYITLGVAGLPFFSSWGSGIARVLGPTGGYLLAFPIAAFVVGYLVQQHSNFFFILISMCTGLFIIFTLGTLQLNFVYFHDWVQSFTNGFLIFSWWDIVKLFAAATIAYRFSPARGTPSRS